jgi:branched-chain amino acid transport system permease protein
MDYLIHILILIGIYVMLSSSLNLVAGYTGMLSIAHAAFYGVGAYTVALMSLNLHTPFLVNLVCAIIICGIFGAVVGIPSLRIKDDYFIIAAFAFQIIAFSVMNNWVSFTKGPMGLPGIPQPNLEDETFALSLGKNVAGYKISVFVLGAMLTALPGALYTTYISYIDPSSFTVDESIFIISIMIIGGAGRLWGPVLGAVVLVMLPELLRFVGMPNSIAANMRQIFYGGALVVCMLWRPQGLVGKADVLRK